MRFSYISLDPHIPILLQEAECIGAKWGLGQDQPIYGNEKKLTSGKSASVDVLRSTAIKIHSSPDLPPLDIRQNMHSAPSSQESSNKKVQASQKKAVLAQIDKSGLDAAKRFRATVTNSRHLNDRKHCIRCPCSSAKPEIHRAGWNHHCKTSTHQSTSFYLRLCFNHVILY